MFRKSLFLGLTVMLAAVLVYLVIQGRRQERQRQTPPRPMEVIRTSPPSPTRVIAPIDLDVVESKMELHPPLTQPGQARPSILDAAHRIVIRNNGPVAYHGFTLRIDYIGRANRILETRTVVLAELLQPGQARLLSEVKVDKIPAAAMKCDVKVAFADLEPTSVKPGDQAAVK